MQVYNPRLSTTNAPWWPCLPPPFSPSPLMQFGILKAMMRFRVFGQVRIQVASIRTDTQDALAVFTKCRESLQDGPRLENIAWRLWHRELKFKGQDDSNLLDEKDHSMGEYAILDEKSAYRPPTPSEPTGFPPPYAVPSSEGDLPTPSTLPTCSVHEGMHPFHESHIFLGSSGVTIRISICIRLFARQRPTSPPGKPCVLLSAHWCDTSTDNLILPIQDSHHHPSPCKLHPPHHHPLHHHSPLFYPRQYRSPPAGYPQRVVGGVVSLAGLL